MNIFSFTTHFGSEDDCRNHFKEQRDKVGVNCKCRHKELFWIKAFGVTSAKNAEKVSAYGAKPLCKVLIFRF